MFTSETHDQSERQQASLVRSSPQWLHWRREDHAVRMSRTEASVEQFTVKKRARSRKPYVSFGRRWLAMGR